MEGRATADKLQNLVADPGIKHDYSSPDVVSGIAPWRQASNQQFTRSTVAQTAGYQRTRYSNQLNQQMNNVISLLKPRAQPALHKVK